jgi:putative transposase
VKFSFIAKHRGIWAVEWMCEALGASRGGFYAWLTRPRSQRSRSDEELGAKVRTSFLASDRTYGARRVWRDLLADGLSCGLHRIERLMRLQALKARPRRRRLPPDLGERQAGAVAPNVLNAAMESFFSSLKTERTSNKTYRTRNEAKADVFDYIERFYNSKRRHSTIGYLSPNRYCAQST